MKDSLVKKKYYPFVILTITLLAVTIFAIIYPMPSPLITTICRDTGWSLKQAGNLVSIFALVMAVSMFSSSVFIDKIGIRKTAVAACAFGAAGSIMAFFGGSSYIYHYASRMISGVGYGMFFPLASALITQWFAPERQPFLQGLRASFDFMGGALAYFIIVPISVMVRSWQKAFGIMGIICAGVLLLFLFLGRDKEMQGKQETKKEASSLGRAVRQRWVWMITVTQIFKALTYNAFSIYLPAFLETERGYHAGISASLTGIMQVAGLLTGLTAGTLAAIAGKRKFLSWPMLLVIAGGGALAVSSEKLVFISLGAFMMGSGVCSDMVFYTTVPGDITEGRYPGIVAAALSFTTGVSYVGSYIVPAGFQALMNAGLTMRETFLVFTIPCLIAAVPMIIMKETGPKGKYAKRGEKPYSVN